MSAGYSGTPLAKKLGLKAGERVWREGMSESVAAEIGDTGATLLATPEAPIDHAHLFVKEREALAAALEMLRTRLAPTGMVWVSWPKRASKVPTDISEDVIRTLCLPIGFVDVKVCAIDAIWSGLKLVIRRELR